MLIVTIWAAVLALLGVAAAATVLLVSFAGSQLGGASSGGSALTIKVILPLCGLVGLGFIIAALATVSRRVVPYVMLVLSTLVLLGFGIYMLVG